jgi:hypothetical protein
MIIHMAVLMTLYNSSYHLIIVKIMEIIIIMQNLVRD